MVEKITDTITQLIQPIVDKRKLLLWDISYKPIGGEATLKISVDLPDHQFISLNEITEFTKDVNKVLDEVDPIEEEYMLDISSPGADRKLSNKDHYIWSKGENVEIHLFQKEPEIASQKQFLGQVIDANDDGVELLVEEKTHFLEYKKISKAQLVVEF